MSDNDKIIQKIKKLLAMAEHENSNPNEAARAASMAAKMMAEYQIDRADVIKAELKRGGGVMDSPISDMEYAAWPVWMQGLAICTAQLFECQVTFERGSSGRKKRIKLMGYEADVQMVQWMYEYLHDELLRLAKKAMKTSVSGAHGSTVKASFLTGAVNTIRERFDEIVAERKAAYASSGTSLMVVKQEAIKEKYGMAKYSKKSSRTRADRDAYQAGVEAGKNVNINRPLGEGEKKRALK